MLERLNASAIVGILVVCCGVGVIAYANPVVAGGMVLVLVGLVVALRGVLSGVLSAFGMGGGF